MTLYSKLEKHLPREKEDFSTNGRSAGFNHCKAQYDELLKRVVVDEEKILEVWTKANFGIVYKTPLLKALAKAIANSPDVIKVEG